MGIARWLRLDDADLPEQERRLLRRQRTLMWATGLGFFIFAVAIEAVLDPPVDLGRHLLARAISLLVLIVTLVLASHVVFSQRIARLREQEIARLAQAEAVRLQGVLEVREELERQGDQLLAGVAHDLRGPLTSIKLLTQLLRLCLARDTTIDRELFKEKLGHIDARVGRMVGLLDEFRDLARLREGLGLDLRRERFDLVAFVRELVAEEQHTAEGQTFRLIAESSPLIGSWDRDRLTRVVTNLLDNACKYSPAGAEIVVGVSQEGSWAVLSVRDQGLGIPAEDLPRIFEPYYRARNVVGQTTGMGLGLASSKQIVEQHGGTMQAASQNRNGSTFTVRLPIETR